MSGRLVIKIRAEAPLMVRGWGDDAVPTRPTRVGTGREQIIPGAGLRGAIRSVHEALTGSCLRVFDGDFVPAYRQQADIGQIAQLRLAVVDIPPSDPEQAPNVQLCKVGDPREDRIDQATLHRLHSTTPGGIRSGTRLSRGPGGGWAVVPDGPWVLIISDFLTDGQTSHTRPYRAQVRELDGDHHTIPGAVWKAFQHALKGADDLRPERVQADGGIEQRWQEVVYAYTSHGRVVTYTVGQRSLARPTVEDGQPLWLRMEGKTITEVRLAQIWRMSGSGAAQERVGASEVEGKWTGGYMPCTKSDELCPSCRLFGSADVSGADEGVAQQCSYRGHLRFSDAVVVGEPVQPLSVTLPPLGQPRPGAGQFYLQNPAANVGNGAKPVPLRQWGSSADRDRPRRIRGRKFYWHTPPTPGDRPERAVARTHHDGAMTSQAMLYPAGTELTATVTFVDIDELQLGALFAALNPATFLDKPDALVSLGGGRPLGFGSCTITLSDESRIWRSEQRYLSNELLGLDELRKGCETAFRQAFPALERTWEYLGAVLSPQTVGGEQVWYPPGEGGPGSESYDEGFEFWKQTTGYELKPPRERRDEQWGYPLLPLPDALDPAQALPVVRKATSRRFSAASEEGS